MKKTCGSGMAAIMLTMLFSCKDEYTICNESKSVNFRAGFYQKTNGSDVAAQLPAVTIALLGSSSIYSGAALQNFSLPLNPQTDSARYLISSSASSFADTLTIVYNTTTAELSPECGSIQINNISRSSTTAHFLDSAHITNPLVNTAAVENVRIYF